MTTNTIKFDGQNKININNIEELNREIAIQTNSKNRTEENIQGQEKEKEILIENKKKYFLDNKDKLKDAKIFFGDGEKSIEYKVYKGNSAQNSISFKPVNNEKQNLNTYTISSFSQIRTLGPVVNYMKDGTEGITDVETKNQKLWLELIDTEANFITEINNIDKEIKNLKLLLKNIEKNIENYKNAIEEIESDNKNKEAQPENKNKIATETQNELVRSLTNREEYIRLLKERAAKRNKNQEATGAVLRSRVNKGLDGDTNQDKEDANTNIQNQHTISGHKEKEISSQIENKLPAIAANSQNHGTNPSESEKKPNIEINNTKRKKKANNDIEDAVIIDDNTKNNTQLEKQPERGEEGKRHLPVVVENINKLPAIQEIKETLPVPSHDTQTPPEDLPSLQSDEEAKAMQEALDEALSVQVATFDMRNKDDDFNNSFLMAEITRQTSEEQRQKREDIDNNTKTRAGRALNLGRHGIRGRAKERAANREARQAYEKAGAFVHRNDPLQKKISDTATYMQSGNALLSNSGFSTLPGGTYSNIPILDDIATGLANDTITDADAITRLNDAIKNKSGDLRSVIENYAKAGIPERAIGTNIFEQIKDHATKQKDLIAILTGLTGTSGKEAIRAYMASHNGQLPGFLKPFIFSKITTEDGKEPTQDQINTAVDKLTEEDIKNISTRIKSILASQQAGTETARIRVTLIAFKTKKIKNLSGTNLEDNENKTLNKRGKALARFPRITKGATRVAILTTGALTGGVLGLGLIGISASIKSLIDALSGRYEHQKEAKEMLNKIIAEGGIDREDENGNKTKITLEELVTKLKSLQDNYKNKLGKLAGKVIGASKYARISKQLHVAETAIGLKNQNKIGEDGIASISDRIAMLNDTSANDQSTKASAISDTLARLEAHAQTGRQLFHSQKLDSAESERKELIQTLTTSITTAITQDNTALITALNIDPTTITATDKSILSIPNHPDFHTTVKKFVDQIKTSNDAYKNNLKTYLTGDKNMIENLTKQMNIRFGRIFRQKLTTNVAVGLLSYGAKEVVERAQDTIGGMPNSTSTTTILAKTEDLYTPGDADPVGIGGAVRGALSGQTLQPGDTVSRHFTGGADGLPAGTSYVGKLADAQLEFGQFRAAHPNLFTEDGRNNILDAIGDTELDTIKQDLMLNHGLSEGNASLVCERMVRANLAGFEELAGKGVNGLNMNLIQDPITNIDLNPTGDAAHRMAEISQIELSRIIKGEIFPTTEYSNIAPAIGIIATDHQISVHGPASKAPNSPKPGETTPDSTDKTPPKATEDAEKKEIDEFSIGDEFIANNIKTTDANAIPIANGTTLTVTEKTSDNNIILTDNNNKKYKLPLTSFKELIQKNNLKVGPTIAQKCEKLEQNNKDRLDNKKLQLKTLYPDLINDRTKLKITPNSEKINFEGHLGYYEESTNIMHLNYDLLLQMHKDTKEKETIPPETTSDTTNDKLKIEKIETKKEEKTEYFFKAGNLADTRGNTYLREINNKNNATKSTTPVKRKSGNKTRNDTTRRAMIKEQVLILDKLTDPKFKDLNLVVKKNDNPEYDLFYFTTDTSLQNDTTSEIRIRDKGARKFTKKDPTQTTPTHPTPTPSA